ncbi:Uncharacterized protein Rs2_23436 [Raphanus sativus]|nr:Uncharacterized protein Rs2_23436 [Raphanus sativus]
MSSGVGGSFSHRCWSLLSTPSPFISLLVTHFKFQMLQSRSLLQPEERDTRQSLRRRHEVRFLVFTVVLQPAFSTCSVCSPAMSREDSLTTVVLRFMGIFPGELHSGCRRESYTVDIINVLQLLMELRSQRSSSCFPSSGSETSKLQECKATQSQIQISSENLHFPCLLGVPSSTVELHIFTERLSLHLGSMVTQPA